jgi:hypothetical protein
MKLGLINLTITSAAMLLARSGQALPTPVYNYPGILGPGDSVAVSAANNVALDARTITAWVNIPVNNNLNDDTLGQPIAVGGFSGNGDFFGVGGTGGENSGSQIPQYDLYIDHWGHPAYASTTGITPGQNTFVAMTYDGIGTVNFYINGVDAGFFSDSGSHVLYTDYLDTYTIGGNTIGGSTTNPTQDGYLSDVSIYDTALTAQDIASLVPDEASPLTLLVSAAASALGSLVLRKRAPQAA